MGNMGKECSDHKHYGWFKCISWSAILSGALVGIGLGFLLNLFGLGIGLSAFTTDKEGITALAIGGYVGLLLGSVAIMFVSGWVAGYLGGHHYHIFGCFNRKMGALYGFLSWSLALLLMVVFSMSINDFIALTRESLANPMAVIMTDREHNERSVIPKFTTSATTTRAANAPATEAVSVDGEKVTRALGVTLFSMFLLFFVGAISSIFGGIYGFKRHDDKAEYTAKNT